MGEPSIPVEVMAGLVGSGFLDLTLPGVFVYPVYPGSDLEREREERAAWIEGVETRLRDALEAAGDGTAVAWETWPKVDEATVNAAGLAEFDLLGMADKDTDETAQAVLADWPDDGYPPPPLDGTFTDLQRYAGIRVFADTLRLAEENELAMLYGLPVPDFVPRTSPTDLWAQAEQIYDEGRAEHALRDKAAAVLAERMAADPELARLETVFAAAKETCRTGHPAGCTYGGMSYRNGYWLTREECDLNHGGRCDLRVACDGAEAVTGFAGRAEDGSLWGWIWVVAACQPCADAYVAKNPEWRRESGD